tara:strand:- start:155 stop:388 length:234 start_codon:yes stop_codon:yes gene_type:complete
MKKTLKSDEYVLALLTACIKKNGGEIKLTEEEIIDVTKTDLVGMFYDTKTEQLVLRIVDPEEVISRETQAKTLEYEN